MSSRVISVAALTCAGAFVAAAQTPATTPQPLTAMPFSPVLDVRSLDRSVNPCDDFYKFSCGGWMTNNPIPADQASWSVYAKLANDNQQLLWGILAEDAKPSPTRTLVQQKVGDYFGSCMNTVGIDAAGLAPLTAALDRLNGLQSRVGILAAITELHHRTAGSFFFGSGTGQDAVEASTVIVELGAGGLGLPDRDYYLKTDPKSVKIREQYAAYIQQLMSLTGETPEQAKADAGATLRIETALAKASLTRVQRRDPHETYHMMTLAQLSELTPAIDWVHYFAVQGAPGVAKVNVSQPEFMKAVQAELTDEDLAALKSYLRFHLLTSAAPYLGGPVRQGQLRLLLHHAARCPRHAAALEDLCARRGSQSGRSAWAGVRRPHLLRRHQGQDPTHDRADRSCDGPGDPRSGLDEPRD